MRVSETIFSIAETLERSARELRAIERKLAETKDISLIDEVGSVIASCFASLRLDLLLRNMRRDVESENK